MKIAIHQKPAELKLTSKCIKQLCKDAACEINLVAESCAIIFVDMLTLVAMHEKYMNDPSPTDVITFDMGNEAVQGEIYICSQQAKIQADEYDVSFKEEVVRLIIHGLLHLKGYNDIEAEERRKMKNLENKLVDFYNRKM